MNFTLEHLTDAAAALDSAKVEHEKTTKRLKAAETWHAAVKASLNETGEATGLIQKFHGRQFEAEQFIRTTEYFASLHSITSSRYDELAKIINEKNPDVNIEKHKQAVGALIYCGAEVTETNVRLMEAEDLEAEITQWLAEVAA